MCVSSSFTWCLFACFLYIYKASFALFAGRFDIFISPSAAVQNQTNKKSYTVKIWWEVDKG